jgi:hypothetical protein
MQLPLRGRSGDNEPFAKAHREFLDALSESDRASFRKSSSSDLVESWKSIDALALGGQKQRLSRFVEVIQSLNGRLQPFFDAVNVMIAVEPLAAVVYGSFRITILVSLNLVSHNQAATNRVLASWRQYCQSFSRRLSPS